MARNIKRLQAKLGSVHSYRYMLHKYAREEKMPSTGAPPPKGKEKMAWWYLPRAARQLLDQQRESGQFGGIAGQAPYWTIQERGLPEVGIKPIEYLAKAVEQWRAELRADLRQWIGGYPGFQGPPGYPGAQ